MERLHEIEIPAVLALQQFSPAMDRLAVAVTHLGGEWFFLLILPLVYWCVDRRVGARLAVVLILSGWTNGALKLLFDLPRPPAVDARIEEIRPAHGGGMPSGHAQNTLVFWGYLAAALRKPALWIVFAAAIVLVPLSRLYLGVHFPSDLFAGLAFGAALLGTFLYAVPRIEAWLSASTAGTRMAVAVAAPVVLLLLSGGNPVGVRVSAALLGIAVGIVIERRWVRYAPAGVPIPRRALAWLLGTGILVLLGQRLDPFLGAVLGAADADLVRYIVLGLWVAAGAPALFVATGLYIRPCP